jgi:hypothetical protein
MNLKYFSESHNFCEVFEVYNNHNCVTRNGGIRTRSEVVEQHAKFGFHSLEFFCIFATKKLKNKSSTLSTDAAAACEENKVKQTLAIDRLITNVIFIIVII